MGSTVFDKCSSLTTLNIGDNVQTIPDYAFYGCSGLTSVTIPNSVTSIGSSAFENCSRVQSIVIGNGVTNIPRYSLGTGYALKSLTIGSGVLSIDGAALRSYSSSSAYKPTKTIWLTNTPPSGYTNAGGMVNYVANDLYTSLKNKTVYPFLSSVFEVGGVKYVPVSPSERTCDAIDCLYDESAAHINIGESVSFKGIAMAVSQVHPYACYDNDFIKEVVLSFEGNIGKYAFANGDNMNSVKIGNTGAVAEYAFYQSKGVQTLEITDEVTNIGYDAFQGCTSMQTATLGEGITSLGSGAFYGCSALQGIVIPNAVKTIGESAFRFCSSMTSVKMGNGVKAIEERTFEDCSNLTDMQIGGNVETIGYSAFSGCSALPTIRIPKAVSKIDNYVFYECKSLKDVIIEDRESILTLGSNSSKPLFAACPLDSVYIGGNISYKTDENHGYSPFYRNTSLCSVTITDKETEISENEFYGCTNLKNVRIGDGVTTIGNWAFSGCSNLDYFAFGSSVETIGQEAFSDCVNVTKLISKASTPPACDSQALDDINKWNCTLTVPAGHLAAYQSVDQWKEFFFVTEGEGGGDTPVIPDTKKCATPVIYYSNGTLTFESATEEAVCQSTITNPDITSYSGNTIQLGVTYHISVYATKPGYEDSDVATATLCWIDVTPQTEGITTDVTNEVKEQKALPVLIRTENRTVTVSGADDGTHVTVYGVNGIKAGSAISSNGKAQAAVNLPAGSIAIVKIGEKAVKVVMK